MRGWLWKLTFVCWATGALGDETGVPLGIQVDLTSKVLKYDRNFAGRAGAELHCLVPYRPGGESEGVARRLVAELQRRPDLGGIPHHEVLVPWAGASALRARANAEHATIIYLSSGLEDQAASIAQAFDDYDGITISMSVEDVNKGVVLGFDLVSGKAHMVLNLTRARRQHVEFAPELLHLMRVVP
jgi:hypothetical protein